jgi:hypothetical protein
VKGSEGKGRGVGMGWECAVRDSYRSRAGEKDIIEFEARSHEMAVEGSEGEGKGKGKGKGE